MKYSNLLLVAVFSGVSACASSPPAEQASLTEPKNSVAPNERKISLDKSIDEFGEVKLLDDETGELKLVCRYIKTTGTRFGTKVCATPKEWEEKRKGSRENAEIIQRNMDARCPNEGRCN